MKKLICLFLCACLISTALPAGVLAAETTATETTLFADDFESYVAGGSIVGKEDTYGKWSKVISSTTSPIQAYEDATQGMVARYSHIGTSNGGPRLHKIFYFDEALTNLTADFRYRVEDTPLEFRLGGTNDPLYKGTSATWEHVRVVMDFAADSYTVYVDGVSKSTGTFTEQDYTCLDFQFSAGVAANRSAYLDNVEFKTTDTVDAEEASNGSVGYRTPAQIMEPFAAYPAAPALTVPTGKYATFTYDGSLNGSNNINTGSADTLFTSGSRVAPAFLQNDPLIRLTNDKRAVQYGNLLKKLFVGENPGSVHMEYYTVLADSGIYITLQVGNNQIVSTNGTLITESTPGAVAGAWNKIKAVFDFENQCCDVYVNDTLAVQNLAFSRAIPANTYEVTLGVYAKLVGAGTVLVDSFAMYQDNNPIDETAKYYGTTGTNWPLVSAEIVLTQDSYVNNLRQNHPRLFINDVQAVKDKINNDPQVKLWYNSYKLTADKCIDPDTDTGPYQYVLGNGRNLKNIVGDIENRLRALGFAYLVEGNEAYVERGLEEIYNLGTFPDWSNDAPILSSGIMNGVACFYDWCYNSPLMTDEVKAEIIRIVKEKALWQFVRSYDGVIAVEIANGTSNRTTVANACGAAMAIAMADEEPELAQKLIDGAVKHVKQTVEAYSPDGAFAEGTAYWGYANRHMFDFLIEMDVAVTDDYTKSEALAWYYTDDRLVNTPLYWAYMNGPQGNFDFGDSAKGFSMTPQLYWVSQTRNQPFYGWYIERTAQRLGLDISSDKAILYFDPTFEYYNDGSMPLDKTFNASDLAQVASMRSSWTAKNALYVAIQGGDNSASHMTNSLGTFVLDANGKRFVKQIGHVDYAWSYPNYMYYLSRAEGNNTIIANPNEEIGQNTDAIARFVAHGEAENEAFTVLDMTETNDVFTDAKRGMFMTKGRGSIVLQDEIKTSTPSEIYWFAHTDAELTLVDGGKGAIMNIDDEKMYARITSGPAKAVFTVMEPELLLPEIAAPDADAMQDITGKKLAIHLKNVSDITLAVEFIPLRRDEGIPTSFTAVKPIADWSVSDNTIPAKRQAGDALVMLPGSPSVLAYEEKFVWDRMDDSVVPYEEGGVLYVPAARATELIYASSTSTANSFSVTRNAETKTITAGLVTKNGVLYVPATALAEALGMQLRTEDNGLCVFADKLPTYTEEAKQAVYNELNTNVFINGRHFDAFSTEKTVYYVPLEGIMPRVSVSSGETVTKTAQQASFVLGGTTYTFHRVDINYNVSKYNTVLGKLVSVNKTMGTSFIPAYMTDGNLSTSAAVKSTTEKNVTFTFELDAPHRMLEFVITDHRYAAGSAMERLVYSVRLEDGTWVEAGSIENMDAVWTSGESRTNTTACTVTKPVTAIKIYMENTDDFIDRIHVYEFEAYGAEYIEPVFTTAETKTTYESQGNVYAFTTEITDSPESAYLACVLYQGNKQVGMKLIPITGQADVSFTINKVDFDSAKVFLIESFFNMRILSEPEIF